MFRPVYSATKCSQVVVILYLLPLLSSFDNG
nr:MAG TPA: hypothetical protein [Caudoviricetes sp.]